MKLKLHQTNYVASKIGIDLTNASFVKLLKGIEAVIETSKIIIDEYLNKERLLDLKIKDILNDNMDEIEFQRVKERELFLMIKKRLAEEYGVIMNYEDKYNDISHSILTALYENYLIEYKVNENQVKNIILNSFKSFFKIYDELDSIVYKKIKGMKKKYIIGSQEYDLLYERLYEDELKRIGIIN